MEELKKYVCWYAFSGMETEGRLRLEEPKTFEAHSKAEALHKYHCYNAWIKDSEPYFTSLKQHMESEYNEGGWGFVVKEIHKDEYIFVNEYFDRAYLSKGWNL